MRLRKLVVVCFGATFCVAVFSLYLMLDRVHFDRTKSGDPAKGPLLELHQRLKQLEQLLEDNHQMIGHLRDSVQALGGSGPGRLSGDVDLGGGGGGGSNQGTDSGGLYPWRLTNGTWVLPQMVAWAARGPAGPVGPAEECREPRGDSPAKADVKMMDVYELLAFDNPDGGAWKQGFDITYEDAAWESTPLQVYVVPHSHNDPGWIKTFEGYFVEQTKRILDNAMVKLAEDSRRRFIWAEVSYLAKWWEGADAAQRATAKRLIDGGQLEIVTGGWVMPDEANVHVWAMLDQMLEGHQWLERHLGVRPRSGWAIDPFGHSPTNAYLLRNAGIQNMLIQRTHYSVKKHLAHERSLEFHWRQSWDSGSSTDILCHMMPFYSYDVPHTCGPDPRVCCQFDFKRLPGGRVNCPWRVPPRAITDDNVEERARLLLDQYRKKSRLFRSPVLLVPLGDDFRYDTAQEWDQQFHNYQRLFDYINAHPELHARAQFGTLSEYFDAMRAARLGPPAAPALPVLSGDFFSYADRDDHYWTGFYTTRPFYKHLDRLVEARLRAAEIAYSLALSYARGGPVGAPAVAPPPWAHDGMRRLVGARRNLGLFQHHDAITGTSKDPVVLDYGNRLHQALNDLNGVISDAAVFLLAEGAEGASGASVPLVLDEFRPNQDSLPGKVLIALSSTPRPVVVYNTLAQERVCVVCVHVSTQRARVRHLDGRAVLAQIGPVWTADADTVPDTYQLSFLVRLPPLALVTFELWEASDPRVTVLANTTLFGVAPGRGPQRGGLLGVDVRAAPPPSGLSIHNMHATLRFGGPKGFLQGVRLCGATQEQAVHVDLAWYGTRGARDKSGAYLFLPDGDAKPYETEVEPVVRLAEGPLFSEVTSYLPHVTHTVRLYNLPGVEGLSLEVTNVVDIHSEVNHELVMVLTTDLQNQDIFYTDLNGFQMQRRRFWKKLPLQANVYQMTSAAVLQDPERRLSLLSAQALGVAGMRPGELQVFLDRRLMQDDNRGLGQGVKDNKPTLSRFRLLPERRSRHHSGGSLSLLGHVTSDVLNHPALLLLGEPAPRGSAAPLAQLTPLATPLPCDLYLLNLRTLQATEGGGPSEDMALILHRRGYDCWLEPTHYLLNCNRTGGKLNLSSVFRDLTFIKAAPASLTLLYPAPVPGVGVEDPAAAEEHGVEPVHELALRPMELATARVALARAHSAARGPLAGAARPADPGTP
ncbi:alpha-mannosidase 2x-like isoform X1 [Lampetra fluviatilis]